MGGTVECGTIQMPNRVAAAQSRVHINACNLHGAPVAAGDAYRSKVWLCAAFGSGLITCCALMPVMAWMVMGPLDARCAPPPAAAIVARCGLLLLAA
jgi:hypothetical protein